MTHQAQPDPVSPLPGGPFLSPARAGQPCVSPRTVVIRILATRQHKSDESKLGQVTTSSLGGSTYTGVPHPPSCPYCPGPYTWPPAPSPWPGVQPQELFLPVANSAQQRGYSEDKGFTVSPRILLNPREPPRAVPVPLLGPSPSPSSPVGVAESRGHAPSQPTGHQRAEIGRRSRRPGAAPRAPRLCFEEREATSPSLGAEAPGFKLPAYGQDSSAHSARASAT